MRARKQQAYGYQTCNRQLAPNCKVVAKGFCFCSNLPTVYLNFKDMLEQSIEQVVFTLKAGQYSMWMTPARVGSTLRIEKMRFLVPVCVVFTARGQSIPIGKEEVGNGGAGTSDLNRETRSKTAAARRAP